MLQTANLIISWLIVRLLSAKFRMYFLPLNFPYPSVGFTSQTSKQQTFSF
jgi:hypothetical protein